MGMEHGENFPDVVAAFHRVTQRLVGADTIEVAATFALPIEIAGVDEVADDALRGAFGDADALESADAVAEAHIVETGLALLERSPVIARRVNAQKCGIVCAITNSVDGRVRVLATVGAVGEADGSLLECV